GVAKKMKLSPPQIGSLDVRFEWQSDGDKWICYNPSLNRTIVEAFNAGKTQ
ncbi:poly [ADP-ribose] polymerase 2, partial [Biomphalaria glabrata]